MSNLEFSLIVQSDKEELIKYATDYESFPNYLPGQLKSIKILEQTSEQTITEEIITFSTIIKNQIVQKTLHHKPQNESISSEIISGPAKGTKILVTFQTVEEGTKIDVLADLKLSLKAKFLSPIIKKFYKMILTGIFYKMNNMALESEKTEI